MGWISALKEMTQPCLTRPNMSSLWCGTEAATRAAALPAGGGPGPGNSQLLPCSNCPTAAERNCPTTATQQLPSSALQQLPYSSCLQLHHCCERAAASPTFVAARVSKSTNTRCNMVQPGSRFSSFLCTGSVVDTGAHGDPPEPFLTKPFLVCFADDPRALDRARRVAGRPGRRARPRQAADRAVSSSTDRSARAAFSAASEPRRVKRPNDRGTLKVTAQ